MKNFYITVLIILSGYVSVGQEYTENVQTIISEISIDSLIYQLRNLSGEDSVTVNGELTIIEHRVSNLGNDLAADYIFETLQGFGLEPFFHEYNSSGKNVLAVQQGTLYPDEFYMICAHYDAVNYHCADDNGSGTAGVLEAARVLSSRQFEYSIIYALWDEEEIGLVGSNYYATQAAADGDEILGVINMDMIAWDGDEDMAVEIHSSMIASSDQLSDYVFEICSLYALQVDPVVEIPGTTASDQAAFWSKGYPAVLIIEEYYGGDFNPYYHSANDRINILNMTYFHEMAKLSIGSLAALASPELESSVSDAQTGTRLTVGNFPNPFSTKTTITYSVGAAGFVNLSLVNSQGAILGILENGHMKQGEYSLELYADQLPKGLYFVLLETAGSSVVHKLAVQ